MKGREDGEDLWGGIGLMKSSESTDREQDRKEEEEEEEEEKD